MYLLNGGHSLTSTTLTAVESPIRIQTGWITPNLVQIIAADIPLGHIGQPEDVANVIIFLASERAARWSTG
jgi:3-oxoacyl-[acyl-carrier protein] reductase